MLLNEIIAIVFFAIILATISMYFFNKNNKISTSFKKTLDLLDVPIITFKFMSNNKIIEYNFIVDTGATNCFISKEALEMIDKKNIVYNNDTSMYTANGNSENVDTYSVEFYYNNFLFIYNFMQMPSFKETSKYIEEKYGIKVVGMIGSDFFKETNANINFKTKKVTLWKK